MKRGAVAGLAAEAVVVGQRQLQRGFNNDFALN